MTALQHAYQPVGSALELFRSREPEVLLSGSAGTGKSRACLEKLMAMALRYPGMTGLIVRKTATSLTSTALVTWTKIVAVELLQAGAAAYFGGSRQEPPGYRFANGSFVAIGGLDKATRIMSSEYDVAYVQEATELDLDDWQAITTRLRNGVTPYQQLLADANPGHPGHWLKLRCDEGKSRMVLCRHEDNPRYYRNGTWTPEGLTYLARLDSLTGVMHQRLRLGIWAAAEGLVYPDFDPAVHLSTRFNRDSEPPKDWNRYLSVDFGGTNPFVCQWWVEEPSSGSLYMYREVYMSSRLVEDHAAEIMRWNKRKREPQPVAVICDHDTEDRMTLERHLGIGTTAAHKAVRDGIEAVTARLRHSPGKPPRLFICRDAVIERDPVMSQARKPCCTEEEIVQYVWDTRPVPGAGGTLREAPVKQHDHGLDAMRYLVAYLDVQGTVRFRSFYTR